MKKVRFLTVIIVMVVFTFTEYAKAQIQKDALLFTQQNAFSSAKSAGMAGALGTIGGDISSVRYNPAGAGLYQKFEVSFTPIALMNRKTISTFLDNTTFDEAYNANIGSLGFVLNTRGNKKKRSSRGKGWKGLNIVGSYNRISNFHSEKLMKGENRDNSILDLYVSEANSNVGTFGEGLNPLTGRLAYDAWLMDPNVEDSSKWSHVLPDAGILQQRTMSSSGRMNEFSLTFGGNYSDRLYIGAGFSRVGLIYEERLTHEESDEMDTISVIDKFSVTEELTTGGKGFTFTFGAILQVADWLRLGAAFHTPMFLTLTDVYRVTLESHLDYGQVHKVSSPDSTVTYEVVTPLRGIASIGFLIGDKGKINIDYEVVNYGSIRKRSSEQFFTENDQAQMYATAANLRLGFEWIVKKYRLRGGSAFIGNPYDGGPLLGTRSFSVSQFDKMVYSFGFGIEDKAKELFKQKKVDKRILYFVDLSYAYSVYGNIEESYVSGPTITNKIIKHGFMATLGFKF